MNEMYLRSKLINKNFDFKKIQITYAKSIKDIGSFRLSKIFGIFIVAFKLIYNLIFYRPKLVYFEIAPTGFALFRDSVFVFISKIFRKKIIFHFHAKGMNKYINSKLKLFYYGLVFRKTKVILLSELLYGGPTGVSKLIKRKEVYILPNGVHDEINDEEFKKILKDRSKNKEPTLLFISNMIESKGPLDVLEVCNLLKNDKLNFTCFFIGAWPDKEILPSVAYCLDYDQYLVAWQNPQPDIYARFVSGQGTLDPIVLHLEYTSVDEINPKVACNQVGTQFMVTWQQQFSSATGPYGVRGQFVNTDMTLGPFFTIQSPTATVAAEFTNPVVMGGGANFLTVWEHDRAGTALQDIHGRLISPYVQFLPLALGN